MVPVIRSLRPARLNSVYALSRALGQAGLRRIPLSEDTAVLCEPVRLCGSLIPNRMAVQPMEGFDAGAGGAPGPTTFQRYEAYAAGAPGSFGLNRPPYRRMGWTVPISFLSAAAN